MDWKKKEEEKGDTFTVTLTVQFMTGTFKKGKREFKVALGYDYKTFVADIKENKIDRVINHGRYHMGLSELLTPLLDEIIKQEKEVNE